MNFWTLLCLVWKLTRNVKESIPSGGKKSFDPCPSWIHWNAMFYSLICIIFFFTNVSSFGSYWRFFFPSKFSHSFKDFVFQFEHFFISLFKLIVMVITFHIIQFHWHYHSRYFPFNKPNLAYVWWFTFLVCAIEPQWVYLVHFGIWLEYEFLILFLVEFSLLLLLVH